MSAEKVLSHEVKMSEVPLPGFYIDYFNAGKAYSSHREYFPFQQIKQK